MEFFKAHGIVADCNKCGPDVDIVRKGLILGFSQQPLMTARCGSLP